MAYKDIERRREYHRSYIKKWRIANPEKNRQYNNSIPWEEHIKLVRKPLKDWGNPNLDPKIRARRNTIRAVRIGRIIKPTRCEECGGEFKKERLDAHHSNYKKWWIIKWLCRHCHLMVHDGNFNNGRKHGL